jgi:hypothetical protein
MTAGYFNFVESHRCERGATFRRTLTIYDGLTAAELSLAAQGTPSEDMADKLRDLTGYAARMQIRASAEGGEQLAELTTENGGITLGDEDGTVELYISATDTDEFTAGDYVYDLELITGDDVYREMQGKFSVDSEVTE